MLQVIAYNKIDLPDSGDYIDEVREFLLGNGLAEEDVHAISAVTGQGVLGVVRRARQVLDQLPAEVSSAFLCTSSGTSASHTWLWLLRPGLLHQDVAGGCCRKRLGQVTGNASYVSGSLRSRSTGEE